MVHLEERAARTLLRLDRLVERAETRRRDAEVMLKARARADDVDHTAETQRHTVAVDIALGRENSVTGGPKTDGEERNWARQPGLPGVDRIPDQSS